MATYKFKDIAFNSTEKKKPIEEDKYHYIGLEHLDSQCLSVNRYGSEIAPVGDKLIMKKGDVLFGKRRAYQKKVAIAPFDGIFSAHGFVLRPKEEVVDKAFFPFFISSDYFLDKAISISVGSLSPTINWTDLKDVEFELPDLQEQKRLAKILWKIEEIQGYATNVLEFYRKLSEHNLIVITSTNTISLGEICNIATGKLDVNAGNAEGKYPFFTCAKEPTKIDNYAFDGDFIIVSGNGEFYCNYYSGKFNAYQRTYVISIKNEFIKEFDTLFIYEIIKSSLEKLRKMAVGGVIKYIKINNLKSIKVPFLSPDHQKTQIENSQKLEKFINNLSTMIENNKQLKQKLLEEALHV